MDLRLGSVVGVLLVQVLPVGPNQLGHAGLRRIVDTNAVVKPIVPPKAPKAGVSVRRGWEAILLENKATSGARRTCGDEATAFGH